MKALNTSPITAKEKNEYSKLIEDSLSKDDSLSLEQFVGIKREVARTETIDELLNSLNTLLNGK